MQFLQFEPRGGAGAARWLQYLQHYFLLILMLTRWSAGTCTLSNGYLETVSFALLGTLKIRLTLDRAVTRRPHPPCFSVAPP